MKLKWHVEISKPEVSFSEQEKKQVAAALDVAKEVALTLVVAALAFAAGLILLARESRRLAKNAWRKTRAFLDEKVKTPGALLAATHAEPASAFKSEALAPGFNGKAAADNDAAASPSAQQRPDGPKAGCL